MRYFLCLAFLVVLSIPAIADEKADIQAVERELRLEKEAEDLYARVVQRAESAVRNSSLGKLESRIKLKSDRLHGESQKLQNRVDILSSALKSNEIESRNYRGRHGRNSAELSEESMRIRYALEDHIAKMDTLKKQMEQNLRDYENIAKKIRRITKKLISRFIQEEIDKQKNEKSKGGLAPELQRLMKKGQII